MTQSNRVRVRLMISCIESVLLSRKTGQEVPNDRDEGWSQNHDENTGKKIRVLLHPCYKELHFGLQIIFEAYFLDQAKLGLQPVDMFFLALEDVLKQFTGYEVFYRFTMGDGFT